MVHIMGGCCHQTQEHIQRTQLLRQLQHTKVLGSCLLWLLWLFFNTQKFEWNNDCEADFHALRVFECFYMNSVELETRDLQFLQRSSDDFNSPNTLQNLIIIFTSESE